MRSYGIEPATQELTPAYNKRVYMVAERLPLDDFYNALPGDEAEIIASENCTVGQIYQDLYGLVYPDYDFDFSAITTPEFAVDGFFINSIESAKNAIQNLQKSHFIDIIQTGNGFKFVPLNSPRDIVNLRREDLAAHTRGKEKPFDFQITSADTSTLPSKVIVNYLDADLNYDSNTQQSTLVVKEAQNDNTLTLTFSEVMTPSRAATICDRSLLFAWILARKYKFSLPLSYLDLEPTDLLPNLFDERQYPIKLEQIRIGANLILECEGVLHDVTPMLITRTLQDGGVTVGVANYSVAIDYTGNLQSVSDQHGNSYVLDTDYTVNNGAVTVLPSGNIAEGTELVISTTSESTQSTADLGAIAEPGDTELLVLDIPLIKDSDADYTLYLAAGGGANWNGASVYISVDNSRYIFSTVFETYSIFGVTNTALLSSGNVTVQVNQPELESVSNNDLDLGFNFALVGNEIIQFKNAQYVDINTYELSDLTRGLRGTETEIDNHQIGDRFVLLQGVNAEIETIIGSALDIGEVRYFKALSNGQTLDEVTPLQITIQGNAQKPYAPVNLAATKDSLGNITITWQRRDRHDANNTSNPPLSESTEEYELQILNNTNNIVRVSSSNEQSYIYLVSEQITDFGVAQNTITVKVAQVSADVGLGTYATATVTPLVSEPAPIINNFSPLSAQVGTTITVTGNNLSQLTSITINGVEQDNLAVIDNQNINFAIAQETISGKITVTTSGGSAISTNALIVQASPPVEKSNYPLPNPVTLPYTINPDDQGTEVIIDGQTDILTIPDDGSAFEIGWGCDVSLDNSGMVTIEKEDLAASGNKTTGIRGINTITDDQTVRLWHRGGNVWKID